MSYFPSGTVYGTLLNFRAEYDAWSAQMAQPPYKAAPQAPVLYIKPANTWTPNGTAIAVPAQHPKIEVGATVSMVIGPDALVQGSWDATKSIADYVSGFVLMNDFSVPHNSYFRPPVKFKCLDGFLGIGDALVPADLAGDPAGFVLEVQVNGQLRQVLDFSTLVRSASQLLADVSEFMSLHPGDVLMLGCDIGADGTRPLVGAGDWVELSAPGFSALSNSFVAEAS